MSTGTRTAAVRLGQTTVQVEVAAAIERARGASDPTWISVLDAAGAQSALERAATIDPQLPLAGLTVGVKDNIDLVGTATTAGCPAFAFDPARSATVVEQLLRAGATAIGKTNLDQFATGLIGTCSPYGAPRSVFDATRVSGGSSSGSAIAVARGDVDIGLGTDTAGSGRVPAGFNDLVGLKPTRGRLSCTGVVPACRSLDCVSVFTRDVDTAVTVLDALNRYPAIATDADVLMREAPACLGAWTAGWADRRPRIGLAPGALDVVGDDAYREAWARTIDLVGTLGEVVEIDLDPFLQAGRMLYDGPWVAERYAAVGAFVSQGSADLDPTVARIISGGTHASAADAFRAEYRMAELRRTSAERFTDLDAILVPTAPLHPTVAQATSDPVGVNRTLGTFTNMVNLLDLCALAVPGLPTQDGLPFGVTMWAPAWHDEMLLSLGACWERLLHPATDRVEVVVAGAHMAGLVANAQLTDRGGRYRRTTTTAPGYRLHLLETDQGPRPGLVRDAGPGALPVEVEVWELSAGGLGDLLGLLPSSLAIGSVSLRDGTTRPGFVAAATDSDGARGVPRILRGWRDHLLARA